MQGDYAVTQSSETINLFPPETKIHLHLTADFFSYFAVSDKEKWVRGLWPLTLCVRRRVCGFFLTTWRMYEYHSVREQADTERLEHLHFFPLFCFCLLQIFARKNHWGQIYWNNFCATEVSWEGRSQNERRPPLMFAHCLKCVHWRWLSLLHSFWGIQRHSLY